VPIPAVYAAVLPPFACAGSHVWVTHPAPPVSGIVHTTPRLPSAALGVKSPAYFDPGTALVLGY